MLEALPIATTSIASLCNLLLVHSSGSRLHPHTTTLSRLVFQRKSVAPTHNQNISQFGMTLVSVALTSGPKVARRPNNSPSKRTKSVFQVSRSGSLLRSWLSKAPIKHWLPKKRVAQSLATIIELVKSCSRSVTHVLGLRCVSTLWSAATRRYGNRKSCTQPKKTGTCPYLNVYQYC